MTYVTLNLSFRIAINYVSVKKKSEVENNNKWNTNVTRLLKLQ